MIKPNEQNFSKEQLSAITEVLTRYDSTKNLLNLIAELPNQIDPKGHQSKILKLLDNVEVMEIIALAAKEAEKEERQNVSLGRHKGAAQAADGKDLENQGGFAGRITSARSNNNTTNTNSNNIR